MEKLSLYPLSSFAHSFWEVATPPGLSLTTDSQIVFSVVGTPQLSIASMDGYLNYTHNRTHDEAVVTPPTLQW